MWWHDIAGSISAGCVSTTLGHPLDTIKVHQQTQTTTATTAKGSTSSFQVAKSLAKGNPIRLFKGMAPPMANQIIMNSVMFSVFNKVKDTDSISTNHNEASSSSSSALYAGLLSGFATAFISTPFDWFKIQAQLALTSHTNNCSDNNNKGSTKTRRKTDVVSILRYLIHDNQNNVLKVTQTLYRGHVANLAREGVFTMIYLGLYDTISKEVKIRSNMNNDNYDNEYECQGQQLHIGQIVVISSFTGACAWICNYPFDTIKSVMQGNRQSRSISMGSAVRQIYRSGGGRAFYNGVGPSTFRAMLVTSSRMLAYEKTLFLLK